MSLTTTGSIITSYTKTGINYTVYTFTSAGQIVVSSPITASILVVGGGGGGGWDAGGGGGGGGVIYQQNITILSGTYNITIGSKGMAATGYPQNGGTGGNTSVGSLFIAVGGGGGGNNHGKTQQTSPYLRMNGGSGGGQGSAQNNDSTGPGTGISGQGYNGGSGISASNGGGGGGGGGGLGLNATAGYGGNGGIGFLCDISGSNTYYAGGGGGGDWNEPTNSSGGLGGGGGGGGGSNSNGMNATYYGGGGGGNGNAGGSISGNGYQGIIILIIPQNPAIIPQLIPGLQLWLDAKDNSTLTLGTGNSLVLWNDKSGYGRNATTSQTVTYNSTAFNSLPALLLTYQCAITASVPSSAFSTSMTIFLIIQNFTIDANFFRGGPVANFINGSRQFADGSDLGLTGFYNPYTNGTPTLCSITLTSGTNGYNEYVNGKTPTTGTITAYISNIEGIVLGKPNSLMAISEVILYNSVLSTVDRQNVEGYLAGKWDLKYLLPTNHPYYSPYYKSGQIPNTISGLQLWVDASDPTSYTLSGSNITQLKDKSGNGNNTTGVSGTQPTFLTNTINGLPVFNMSSAGGFYGNMTNTTTTMTVFMIVIMTNIGINYRRLIDFTDGVAGDNGGSVTKAVITFSPIQLYRANGAGGGSVNSGISTVNTAYLVSCYFDNINGYLGVNGTYYTPFAVSGNFNINKYGIGLNFNNNTVYGGCQYGEVIVYNTVLSTANRQQIEGYLAWKWGTNTSLLTNHPYYNTPTLYTGNIISQLTPPKISGLQLWLDAQKYSSLTLDSSNNVTQWNDQSGYGRNATPYGFAATNVNYRVTGFNNLPAIAFSIVGQGLQSLMPAGTLSAGCSLFVVFKTYGLQNSTLLCRDTAGSIGGPFMIYGAYRYISALNGNSSYNIGTTSTANTIYSCTISNTSIWNDYINGKISFSDYIATTYSDSSTHINIGLRNDNALRFIGTMSEILIYNSVLSTEKRQQIEGYLAWKWNMVSSLPKTHPYYIHTPTTLIPDWNVYPYQSNAFVQTYIKDFVDISGNLVVRNANINVLNGDISFNGSMYLQTSINTNSITTGNITATNNLLLSGVSGSTQINGNVFFGNTVSTLNLVAGNLIGNSSTMNGNLYIANSLYVPNGNIYLSTAPYSLIYAQNTNNMNFGGINKPLLVNTTNGVTISGYLAGNSLISSTNPDKTLIGANALQYHNTDYTVAFGYNTLNIYGNKSTNGGNYLTAIGANAGSIMLDTSAVGIVQTGQYNTFIGANTGIDSSDFMSKLAELRAKSTPTK